MPTRTIAAAAIAAVLALGAAACSSDDSTSTSSGTQAPSGTAKPSDTQKPASTQKPTDTMAGDDMATDDIVTVAVDAGQFTTLASLLEAAGLVETLQGDGPFTVFAPTDAAFAKVPQATLDALAADPEALTDVLTYHVYAGELMAADVAPGTIEMVNGDPLEVTVEGGTVKVGDATVTATDIVASNGVIHVIDTVLLPPEG